MTNHRLTISSLCAAFLLAACADATPDEVIAKSFAPFAATHECFDFKGTQRCYYTVPPTGKPSTLLVALHPAFTSVKFTENVSRMAATAVPKDVLVIYPEGIDKQWNDGRVMTEVDTYNLGTDDVAFINEVTARVQEKYGIAVADTSVAGMSNGGMMSLRLACQSDSFARVGAVVANLPKGLRNQCTATPKPMILMFGAADTVVDAGGGTLAASGVADEWGEVESAADTEAFFAARHGCDASKTERETLANPEIDSTKAHITRYTACRKAPLTAITIEGMGHTWPGESSRLLAWATFRGKVTQQFSATDRLVDFVGGQEVLTYHSSCKDIRSAIKKDLGALEFLINHYSRNEKLNSEADIDHSIQFFLCVSPLDNSSYVPENALGLFANPQWGDVAFKQLKQRARTDAEAAVFYDQMKSFVHQFRER